MATNAPKGDGQRKGAVRKRTQLKTKVMGEDRYTKRSKETGEFMDQTTGPKKFKGVRKEKTKAPKKKSESKKFKKAKKR